MRTKESEESIVAGHSTPTKKFTIGLLYPTAYSRTQKLVNLHSSME